MNTDNISTLVTILVGIGGTLAPVVFWVIEALVKPFVKDNRMIPFFAIAIGAVIGAALPYILDSFGMDSIPVVGSIIAGIVGGVIAISTYNNGVKTGMNKTKQD